MQIETATAEDPDAEEIIDEDWREPFTIPTWMPKRWLGSNRRERTIASNGLCVRNAAKDGGNSYILPVPQ